MLSQLVDVRKDITMYRLIYFQKRKKKQFLTLKEINSSKRFEQNIFGPVGKNNIYFNIDKI